MGQLYIAMRGKLGIKKVNEGKQATICQVRGTLEVQGESSSQTFDLSNYDYHKVKTTDYDMIVEVNFASHAFLPKSKQLFFPSMDERAEFIADLEKYLKARQETSYANQVEAFLEKQFEKWTSVEDSSLEPMISRVSRVPTEKIVAFLTKARIDRDLNIEDLGKTCNFQGWRKLYHRLLKLKTSELLVAVFDNYSIWKGEKMPREMTRERVREFLQPPGSLGHQNESNVSEENLTNMIQVQDNINSSHKLNRFSNDGLCVSSLTNIGVL